MKSSASEPGLRFSSKFLGKVKEVVNYFRKSYEMNFVYPKTLGI